MKKIWTLGYGILKGTHFKRHELFSKRLQYIYKGIGKHLAVIDIRRAGSGSINGEWFQQGDCPERWLDFPFAMWRLVETCGMVNPREFKYLAEPALANNWGATQAGLKRYAQELDRGITGFADTDQYKSLQRIVGIAQEGERAVVLMCGCKPAFKKNGTSWNCHRVPLALKLVDLLGSEWSIIHL